MTKKIWYVMMAPLMAVALVVVGCSIDDSDDNSNSAETTSTNVVSGVETNTPAADTNATAAVDQPVEQVDVTGTWTLSAGGTVIDTLVLEQTGVSVQGTNQDGRRVAGSVSGDRLLADLLPVGGLPTISINAGVSGNEMSGTASSSVAMSSFTATRVVSES